MLGMLQPDFVLHGRYVIVRQLGQGGMGAVYLAHDRSLEHKVAIKENFDSTPSAQKQFEIEARVLARLSHPNLPRVTDYFITNGGKQYLVMDYVPGKNLEEVVAAQGPFSASRTFLLMNEVFNAVEYLHNQKPVPIIHRDIKPSNLRQRTDGHIILVDFGIVKQMMPFQGTGTGARAVSPGFSPPEQYSAGEMQTNQRSDIYSLGATIYFLLSGRLPDEPITRRLKEDNSTVSLLTGNDSVTPVLRDAVIKMMALDPEKRFSSIEEMRESLTQVLPISQTQEFHRDSSTWGTPTLPIQSPAMPSQSTSLPQQWTFAQLLPPKTALRIPLKTSLDEAAERIFRKTREGLVHEVVRIAFSVNSVQGVTTILHSTQGSGTSRLVEQIKQEIENQGNENCIVGVVNLSNPIYLKQPLTMWNHIVRTFGWQAKRDISYETMRGIQTIYKIIRLSPDLRLKGKEERSDWKLIFKLLKVFTPVEAEAQVGGSTVKQFESNPVNDNIAAQVDDRMSELANYMNKRKGKMVLILNKVKHLDLLERLRTLAEQPGAVILTIVDESDYQAWCTKDQALVTHFSSATVPIYVAGLPNLPVEFCTEMFGETKQTQTTEFSLFLKYLEYRARGNPYRIISVLRPLCRPHPRGDNGIFLIERDILRGWYKYAVIESVLQTRGWNTWFADEENTGVSLLEGYDVETQEKIRDGIYHLLDYLMEESETQKELTEKQITSFATKNCNLNLPSRVTKKLVRSIMNTLRETGRIRTTNRGWDFSGLSQSQ